jgi:hypothetical protein
MSETLTLESGLIRQRHKPTKYSRWIALALIGGVIGAANLTLWRRFPRLSRLLEQTVATVPPRKVSFHFLECAGKRSVFILDNQTTEPIYARVQRVDFWKEYKEANIQYGVHIVKYKPPNATGFVDRSDRFDAPIPFATIPAHASVRYGVDLREQTGLYKVEVPYMETKDTDLVKRMNEGIHALTKDDFKRLETAWREAWSDTIVNKCQ